jgi:hypothetical protein
MTVRSSDGQRWGGVSARRLLAWSTALALLVAACGDSESDSAEPAATTAPTTATTTPPTASTAPAVAPITPEVLCVDPMWNDVAFAYVNDADVAVVLEDAASSVSDGEEADLAFVPIVFAPGRVSPAFWITPAVDDGVTFPAWTVTGPDGVARTAAADDATPTCTDELLVSTTPDSRQPKFEFRDAVVSADGSFVTFVSDLAGVPATSVCPAGLEPQPVSVVIDDGDGQSSVDGVTATWVVELAPGSTGVVRARYQSVAALVLDQCSADGATQQVWPGGAFDAIYVGVGVCLNELDGVITYFSVDGVATPIGGTESSGSAEQVDPSYCPPFTGGARTRPA